MDHILCFTVLYLKSRNKELIAHNRQGAEHVEQPKSVKDKTAFQNLVVSEKIWRVNAVVSGICVIRRRRITRRNGCRR